LFIFSVIIRLKEPNDQIEKYIDYVQRFISFLLGKSESLFQGCHLKREPKNLEVPFLAGLDQKTSFLAGKTRANMMTHSVLIFRSAVVKSCLWLAS